MQELLQVPIIAFMVVAIAYAIGDYVGTVSKAWIPSVFVVAVMFLLGYWTVFPDNIVEVAGLGPPMGGIVAILLCITHMGTSISLRDLAKQWKIIVVCLAGLVGMVAACWFIAGLFVDKSYIVAGVPPLTGGVVAATMMQTAAAEAGMQKAAILAICMYVVQGFAGYPLTAIMLKAEGRTLLKDYRGGKGRKVSKAGTVDQTDGKMVEETTKKKKLIPAIPDKFYSTALSLAKLASVAVLAHFIQVWTTPWGNFKLNQAVVALILGIIFTEIGYLEKDILRKNGCFNFLMFVLMVYIFSGLKDATPQMLLEILGPMLIIIVIGVAGMAIFSILAGKLLGVSLYMSFATALTALYGFPPNYILTEESAKAMTDNPDEKQYLMDCMLPQMIVGGFVTVTITSIIIASLFIPML